MFLNTNRVMAYRHLSQIMVHKRILLVEWEVRSLEQPIRMKNNGQISIVLNKQKRDPVIDNLNKSSTASKPIPSEHAALKEIEDELGVLVGMEEMKRLLR